MNKQCCKSCKWICGFALVFMCWSRAFAGTFRALPTDIPGLSAVISIPASTNWQRSSPTPSVSVSISAPGIIDDNWIVGVNGASPERRLTVAYPTTFQITYNGATQNAVLLQSVRIPITNVDQTTNPPTYSYGTPVIDCGCAVQARGTIGTVPGPIVVGTSEVNEMIAGLWTYYGTAYAATPQIEGSISSFSPWSFELILPNSVVYDNGSMPSPSNCRQRPDLAPERPINANEQPDCNNLPVRPSGSLDQRRDPTRDPADGG